MTLQSGGLQSGPPLILASQSRYRAGLLDNAGLRFSALPAHIDEAVVKRQGQAEVWSADRTALRLATLKAGKIAATAPDALVIGCDQILVCGDDWFDKPEDVAEARRHLQRLRGRSHVLMTAVICQRGDAILWQHVATPRLTMRMFSDDFLEAYLAEEAAHVTSTVGAYRLEGPGQQLFAAIEGEYSAIIGLPLLPLFGFLREFGVLRA